MNREEREAFIKDMVVEELKPVDVLRPVFVERDIFEGLRARVGEANPDKVQRYFPQGMLPPEHDGDQGLVAGFCLEEILDQTENYSDQDLAKFLLHWTARMKIRIIKWADLIEAGDEKPDEKMIEELVDAEIESTWQPRE